MKASRPSITVTGFIQYLSVLMGWGLTDLDQRVRLLKIKMVKDPLLPKGGRGRHAPGITAEHVANILIAKLAAEKVDDAPSATWVYGYLTWDDSLVDKEGRAIDIDALKYSPHRENLLFPPPEFIGQFRRSLAAMVAEPRLSRIVKEVTVCLTWPEARILCVNPDGEEVSLWYRKQEGSWPPSPDKPETPLFKKEATIYGGFKVKEDAEGNKVGEPIGLYKIALDLNEKLKASDD